MALTKLEYEKTWLSSGDFPTYEDSEQQVRADLQYHPDAVRAFINDTLIPELGRSAGSESVGDPRGGSVRAALDQVDAALARHQEEIEELAFGETPTVVKSRLSRENILINWDFREPVDTKQGYIVPPDTPYYSDTGLTTQAGTVGAYTTAVYVDGVYGEIAVDSGAYYVDWAAAVRGYISPTSDPWSINQWRLQRTLPLLIQDGGILLDNSKNTDRRWMLQILPQGPEYFAGKQVCLSVLLDDGTLCSAVSRFESTEPVTLDTVFDAITLRWQIASIGVVQFVVYALAGKSVKVVAAKLELGDYQTLAHQDEAGGWVLNDPPDRAAQLALCSQYDPKTGEFYGELLGRQSQLERLEGALETAVGELTATIETKVKIETGSYVGTNTSGADNPQSLTFGFTPTLVIVVDGSLVPRSNPLILMYGAKNYPTSGSGGVTWSGNTVSWYATSGVNSQLNYQNNTYLYVALG